MAAMTVISAGKTVDPVKLYSEFLTEYPGYNVYVSLVGDTFYLSPETPNLSAVATRIPQIIAAHVVPTSPPPAVQNQAVMATVTTTDATPTDILSDRTPNNSGVTADLQLIAVDTANGDCRIWKASVAAKKVGVTVSLIGTPVIYASHADAGAASWAVAAVVVGAGIRIRVTGAAGRTISWSITGTVVRFGPQGIS